MKEYDYGNAGLYCITICTANREHYFGEIIEGKIQLSNIGILADSFWHEIKKHSKNIELHQFVVMPNHIHGILEIVENIGDVGRDVACNVSTQMSKISPQSGTIGRIIGSYKGAVSKHAHRLGLQFDWQSRFHDHIIRNEKSLEQIQSYIINNPENWEKDKFNQNSRDVACNVSGDVTCNVSDTDVQWMQKDVACNVSTDTDIQWMEKALLLARKAEAAGEVPVGAVLVKDNQLIAEGWNQPISRHDATSHAEIMAMRAAGKKLNNYRLIDTTMYVTLEPCSMCVGAMILARVAKVVYGASEPRTGALGGAFNLLAANQHNHIFDVQSGVLAEASKTLLQNFFQSRRK
jgi:tRNA(adenine34) deaminase